MPGETFLAYLARRTGVAAAEAELDRPTDALGDGCLGRAISAYSEALERFLALGGDDFEARAGVVCAELGLGADRLRAVVGELSGGQAARAGLAAILLARFDVFLLDEPTNDLDFAGLDRLEGVPRRAARRGRRGLPRPGFPRPRRRAGSSRSRSTTHTAVEYAGGWSEYVERRALARSQQSEQYQAWVGERPAPGERIRTQRSWSEHGVKKAAQQAA